jgi:hypothetical protein
MVTTPPANRPDFYNCTCQSGVLTSGVSWVPGSGEGADVYNQMGLALPPSAGCNATANWLNGRDHSSKAAGQIVDGLGFSYSNFYYPGGVESYTPGAGTATGVGWSNGVGPSVGVSFGIPMSPLLRAQGRGVQFFLRNLNSWLKGVR